MGEVVQGSSTCKGGRDAFNVQTATAFCAPTPSTSCVPPPLGQLRPPQPPPTLRFQVSNGCVIKKSCVGPHCKIGSNVRLTNCILMDHVQIADKVCTRPFSCSRLFCLPFRTVSHRCSPRTTQYAPSPDIIRRPLPAALHALARPPNQVNIANSVICSNAEVCEGASLKDAQVGFNVTVEAGAIIKGEAISGDVDEDDD